MANDPAAKEVTVEKMYVIFYKVSYQGSGGKGNDGATFFDKLIGWWTADFKDKFNGKSKNGYCHTELLFFKKGDAVPEMVSSSVRDHGARGKPHVINYKAWTYFAVSNLNNDAVYKFSKSLGGKYDWLGVLGFIVPIRDNPKNWFCSELTLRGLQIGGCVELGKYNASSISPNDLFDLLKNNGSFTQAQRVP